MIKGWKRSPRGKIFGVVTGLAEWRDLDPQTTRTVFTIIALCTMPASIIIYLILALLLPMGNGERTVGSSGSTEGAWMNTESTSERKHSGKDVEDAEWEERSTDDIRREYEDLKKKVESMEAEMFDKEKDWDARFKDSEDKDR